jgi:YD repeat-containing protein
MLEPANRLHPNKRDNYPVTNYYDGLDRPVRTTYPDGTYEQVIYNKLDAEWQRDREGRWTHSEHDSQRKAVAVTDAMGRTTRFDWCACGALEGIVDGAGNATTFVRDLQSRVLQKVYADTKFTSYGYEAKSGRLAWMQDARGTLAAEKQRTNYQYYIDNNLELHGRERGVAGAGADGWDEDQRGGGLFL